MEEIKNEFSWSKSRADLFERCLRGYYFQYYGSWDGWNWEAHVSKRELYLMKNLQSIPLWIGSSVHLILSWLMRRASDKKPVTIDEAILRLNKNMEFDWFYSANHYAKDDCNKTAYLQDHYYYDFSLSSDEYERAVEIAEQCIKNLYQNTFYQKLTSEDHLSIVATEAYDSFKLSDFNVWAVPDLVVRDGRNLLLVDWKSSKEMGGEGVNFQLSIYTTYCSDKWQVPVENISASEINLNLNEVETREFTDNDIQYAKAKIIESADKMRSLLVDRNKNIANIKDFPKTEAINLCRKCKFRRACGREGGNLLQN